MWSCGPLDRHLEVWLCCLKICRYFSSIIPCTVPTFANHQQQHRIQGPWAAISLVGPHEYLHTPITHTPPHSRTLSTFAPATAFSCHGLHSPDTRLCTFSFNSFVSKKQPSLRLFNLHFYYYFSLVFLTASHFILLLPHYLNVYLLCLYFTTLLALHPNASTLHLASAPFLRSSILRLLKHSIINARSSSPASLPPSLPTLCHPL